MKRFLILALLLLVAIADLLAQASFTVSAPSRVAVGEKFAVTFRLKNGEGSGIKPPEISGCTMIFGPAISSSKSFTVINGKSSSSSVYDYTYTYRADKEGTYSIGVASINVDGHKMTTRPLKITIVAASASQQGGIRQSGGVSIDDISTMSSDRPVSNNDVFVRIILSKSSAYEQESVECSIKLYTKYPISSFFPTKQPSFDGFLIQELDVRPALNQAEVYNGQRYMTALLKKCIIFPQKAGKLTINSGMYDINVVQYDNINMGPFSVRNPTERKIKVNSNSASIEIRPLPTPQPEGFTGAVGKFNVTSRIVGNNFRTFEPATLMYDITGTGNIKYIKEPKIDFPTEFEEYTPKKEENVKVVDNQTTGSVSIEYTFVPQSVGDFLIGGNKFVYFDIDQQKYVSIDTPPHHIKVEKGKNSKPDKKGVVQSNKDILNIAVGDKNLSKSHDFIIVSPLYWIFIAVLLFGLIAALIINRRRIRRASDIMGMKIANASKVARKRLKSARKCLDNNQSDKFYEEILKAIWGYLSDKLAIPVSILNRDNIVAKLEDYGVGSAISDETISLIDDCEMARYTPAQSHSHLQTIYDKTANIINELERVKRK